MLQTSYNGLLLILIKLVEAFSKNSNNVKGLPLVAWNKACHPKRYEGLGLRKGRVVNTSFMTKLSWKFISQLDNFLVQQMLAECGSPDAFFLYKVRQSDSWILKCLLRN